MRPSLRLRLSDVVTVPLGMLILVVAVVVSLPRAASHRMRLRRGVRRQRAELAKALFGTSHRTPSEPR